MLPRNLDTISNIDAKEKIKFVWSEGDEGEEKENSILQLYVNLTMDYVKIMFSL